MVSMIQQSTCTVPWKRHRQAAAATAVRGGHRDRLLIDKEPPSIRPNAGGKGKVNTLAGGVADPGTRFADRPVTDTGIRIILV